MPKKSLIVITVEEHLSFNLNELCRVCGVTPEWMQELIDFGAIEPRGYSYENWIFDEEHLRRVKTIVHLQNDLEVNLAGAVLALDLIDEIERMRAQIEVFEKYLEIK